MKKVYSFMVSSALVVANLATLPSFAVNDERTNIIGTSAQMLENDLRLDSGIVIPSGSVALTVSIDSNDGFITSALKLDVEGADILLDVNDKPIITKGEVLSNSLISAAAEDNQIVVSSAAAAVDATYDDGDMFTIYLSEEPSDVLVYDISDFSISAENYNTGNRWQKGHRGDVDIDNNINAIDCSYVLAVVQYQDDMSVADINAYHSDLLPCGANAGLADTDRSLSVNSTDAQKILDFYSYVAIGHTKDEAFNYLSTYEGNYCYQEYPIII